MASRFALKIRKHWTSISFDVKKANFFVQVGSLIVVETNRGEEVGEVVKLPLACDKHGLHEDIRVNQILRVANEQDKKTLKELEVLEQEYLRKANELFEQKAPNMKLISCEVLFSKRKAIFYYRPVEEPESSNNNSNIDKKKQQNQIKKGHHINFNSREMNKELFRILNIPIELKEMGNRASAYVIGGLGHCGYGLCCTSFLRKPMQISIKMAKEQSLAINIPKISGVCGKLLCCLAYEHKQYENGCLPDLKPKNSNGDDMELEAFGLKK